MNTMKYIVRALSIILLLVGVTWIALHDPVTFLAIMKTWVIIMAAGFTLFGILWAWVS